jgi:hypothetical protein
MVKSTILYFNLHTRLFLPFTFFLAWVKFATSKLQLRNENRMILSTKLFIMELNNAHIIWEPSAQCSYFLTKFLRICIKVKQMEKSTYQIGWVKRGDSLSCAAVPIIDDLDHTHFVSSEITGNRAALVAGFTISLSSFAAKQQLLLPCGSIEMKNTVSVVWI